LLDSGIVGWPLEVHLLKALQRLDGAVDSSSEGILILVISKLHDMAALALKFGRAGPILKKGRSW
jgi:hypothetical protein